MITVQLVDLHTHTTVSDGPVSPQELFAQAQRVGIKWLAIADHDTTAGLMDCARIAAERGIRFIPAVEITAVKPDGGQAHILGYGIRPDAAELDDALAVVREARTDGCRKGVEALRKLGFDITWKQAQAFGPGVFKLHVMQTLVDAGYTNRIRGNLYRELCAPGGPLAVHAGSVAVAEAVRLILSDELDGYLAVQSAIQ